MKNFQPTIQRSGYFQVGFGQRSFIITQMRIPNLLLSFFRGGERLRNCMSFLRTLWGTSLDSREFSLVMFKWKFQRNELKSISANYVKCSWHNQLEHLHVCPVARCYYFIQNLLNLLQQLWVRSTTDRKTQTCHIEYRN